MTRALMIAAIVCIAGASFAHSQEATERFIPIGRSPGLSGKATTIGTIEAADAGARSLTVAGAGAPRKAAVTDRTRIWVDRSRLQQGNTNGSFADLQKGRRVEIKWDAKKSDAAEWIKVETAP